MRQKSRKCKVKLTERIRATNPLDHNEKRENSEILKESNYDNSKMKKIKRGYTFLKPSNFLRLNQCGKRQILKTNHKRKTEIVMKNLPQDKFEPRWIH